MHRDIKPENFFLARMPNSSSSIIKLGDFGESKVLDKGFITG